VVDLFQRAPVGTKVIVLNRDGSRPNGLTLPPPAPKKAKPVAVSAKAPVLAPLPEPALPDLPEPPPLDPALGGAADPI
jgi:hypothetical protein